VETRLSPSVRRACQQHGVDPSRITGTGRNGRITREDVERALDGAAVSSNDIPHDRMRLKIAENMVRAVAEVQERASAAPQRPGPRPASGNLGSESRLSPSVRRACQQHGIDPSRITGTGRSGRITREDVERALDGAAVSSNNIPHDRMRLKIAENMVRAVAEAPHVTALFEADFSAISAHKAALAERGTKLSYTAYIVKAAAEAMAVAPAINGRWEPDRIAISPTIDIGVGTALGDKGLVVPVVRDAGSLSLEQIGAKLDDLTRRARNGQLTGGDVSGGSFTISNHGVSGSLLASPIILHQGQAAILGVGKLQKRVVVREADGEDAIVILPMAYVTLTIDHRVVDGHQTNAWLSRFVEILESWPEA
jgi:2-oxoglutarate dehydrogenase E2 component (dihydrolipoamide succinyltransferase)